MDPNGRQQVGQRQMSTPAGQRFWGGDLSQVPRQLRTAMQSRPESQTNHVPSLKTFLPRKAVSAARKPHVNGQAFERLLVETKYGWSSVWKAA